MLILEDVNVKDVLPLNILRNSQFFPRIAHKCKCPRVRMRVRAFHSDVLFFAVTSVTVVYDIHVEECSQFRFA